MSIIWQNFICSLSDILQNLDVKIEEFEFKTNLWNLLCGAQIERRLLLEGVKGQVGVDCCVARVGGSVQVQLALPRPRVE